MRHRTSMASLFDGIFQASGDMPVNSLFSSSNKFKTVRPAETLAAEAPAAQSNVEKQAKPASTISAKNVSKGSKRKAAAAAEPQLNTTHKRSKVAASHSPLHDNKGSKRQQQKTATAAAEEPHSKKRKKPEAAPSVDGGASSAAAEHSNISSNGQAVPVDASDANAETVTRLSPEEEAAKLRRTIFVGNLPSDIKKKMLQNEFSQYGRIESIRKRSVPVKLDAKMSRKAAIITGNISESRGTIHAYVVFHDEPAALAALASNMHVVGGLHIRVDRAGQSAHGSAGGSVMYERNRTVFVGNLPFDVEDEELIVFFNKNCTKLGISNPVDAVRVVRDSASQLGKGFGFVQFSDQAAARAALGCDGQLLRKRAIRITKAVKVPAHLKDLGKGNPGKNAVGKNASERKPAGAKQSRPANKAVAALQRKAEPAENWQGFKTKGAKKTVAAAVNKSAGAGQRLIEGKRKSTEKRPSVVMRKQRSLAK